jgi:hypothetical protein
LEKIETGTISEITAVTIIKITTITIENTCIKNNNKHYNNNNTIAIIK